MRIEINPDIKYMGDTQRVFEPERTLEITRDLLPKIGVTRIANITDLDRVGIPVFSAIRPSAAQGAISIYSGKGANDTVARISAIMESFERCLAEQPEVSNNLKGINLQCERVVEPFDTIRTRGNAVDPNELLLPSPFMYGMPLEWLAGWDLLNDEDVYVPANAVFHPYNAGAAGVALFRSNTNGLASGNTIEEATLHGLLEVIERDALSAAEFNKMPGKEIILNEHDGTVYQLKKKFENAGIAIKLWLLNSDVGLPTVVTALDDTVLKDPALLVMGAGSHLRPEIAVSRALTEAAQSRVVQIHGAREDTDREKVVRTFGYESMKRMNRYWYAETDEKIELRQMKDLSGDTPAKNINTILKLLKKSAGRAIVVNLSRGVEIPVIRAVIPGFELYTIDRERRGVRIRKLRKKASRVP